MKNETNYYEIIRKNIRIYRKLKGITQKDLANLTGYSSKHISDIENKNMKFQITIPTLGKIASALGKDSKDFLSLNLELSNNNNEFKLYDNEYYYNIVRNNIKKERIIKGLTQQELADKAELTREFISQIESTNKSFSITSVEKIANALNLDIKNLFTPNIN